MANDDVWLYAETTEEINQGKLDSSGYSLAELRIL